MLKSGKYQIGLLDQVLASLLFYFCHPHPSSAAAWGQRHPEDWTMYKALSLMMHSPWGEQWRLPVLQVGMWGPWQLPPHHRDCPCSSLVPPRMSL